MCMHIEIDVNQDDIKKSMFIAGGHIMGNNNDMYYLITVSIFLINVFFIQYKLY